MRYWMPITEDELYEWSQCYCWKLPQRPMPVQCNERAMVAAVRRRVTQLREKEEDAIIVSEFAVEATAEGASRIPFFLVETLYGFSAPRTEILRDRYAAFGLKTMVLDAVRKNVCHQAIVDRKFAEEGLDMRLGVKAVLDLFRVTPPENCKQLMVAAKHGIDGRGDCLLSVVFDYSRAEPWKCEGLLAGLCDLGMILRQRLSGTELDALNELSGRVAEALKREEVSCCSLIGQLLSGLGPSDVFDPALVLFLSWKFFVANKYE